MKLLASLVVFCLGVHAQISQLRLERVYQKQLDREYKRSILDDAEEPPERFFDQRIDHFDKASNATFRQKYYVSTEYYKPGGPIYLYNAGEASLSTPRAFKAHLGELANLTNGAMVLMEHRYYGKSMPVASLKPETMHYLNTRQALADMAHFIRTWKIPQDLGVQLPSDIRWIVVGGSYPANLAAWMRLKYPHYVFAAYASSGPVKAKLDYYEYDLAVGDALPTKCADNIAKMVEYVDSVLDTKDDQKITQLKQDIGLEGVKEVDDFASALVDIASYTVQYGQTLWQNKLCALPVIGEPVQGHPDQVATVQDVVRGYQVIQKEWMKTNSFDWDYYNADAFTKKQEGAMWSWMYQVCTEYGYWQTAPPKPMRALRSKYVTVEYYEKLCRMMFDKYVPEHANVELINRHYQAQSISMNRIVYVDGEYDPWRRLSVNAPEVFNKPISKDMPRYLIEKGSHCTDLGSKRPTDSESKIRVKKAVDEDIVRWLKTESMKMPEPGGL